MVRQLYRGEFVDGADNVVLIDGPGTGKTHIATAPGIQAVEHHRKKVRVVATVDLVNALEHERAANKAGQLAERLLPVMGRINERLVLTSAFVTRSDRFLGDTRRPKLPLSLRCMLVATNRNA